MILKKLEPETFASNCYIVGDESSKATMIIDPGAAANWILGEIDELGLQVTLILVTHAHGDHVGALREVKEATGAPVAIHNDDAKSLEAKPSWLPASFQTPPAPDRLLKDGDAIDIGSLHFVVIHTPGHTPGGICILGEGMLFSGDTLFNEGIGRSDFPGGSYSQLMRSIRTRLLTLPDETVVYPGHGPETTIGHERQRNPFLRA